MARIGGKNYAEYELGDIQETVADSEAATWGDLLHPRILRIVLLGGILAALQQWVGINVIFNDAEEIYRSAGFGVTDTLLNIVATGVIALIANILAVPLVDRYGRRFAQQSEWCDATLSVRPQELGRLAGSRTIRFRFHCLALIKPNRYGALLCHQFQIAVCAQRTVLNLGAAGESRGAYPLFVRVHNPCFFASSQAACNCSCVSTPENAL